MVAKFGCNILNIKTSRLSDLTEKFLHSKSLPFHIEYFISYLQHEQGRVKQYYCSLDLDTIDDKHDNPVNSLEVASSPVSVRPPDINFEISQRDILNDKEAINQDGNLKQAGQYQESINYYQIEPQIAELCSNASTKNI